MLRLQKRISQTNRSPKGSKNSFENQKAHLEYERSPLGSGRVSRSIISVWSVL